MWYDKKTQDTWTVHTKEALCLRQSSYHSLHDGRWSGHSPTSAVTTHTLPPSCVHLTTGPLHLLFPMSGNSCPRSHVMCFLTFLGPLFPHHLTREAFWDLFLKRSPHTLSLLRDTWGALHAPAFSMPLLFPLTLSHFFEALLSSPVIVIMYFCLFVFYLLPLKCKLHGSNNFYSGIIFPNTCINKYIKNESMLDKYYVLNNKQWIRGG